ncbi:DUF1028 domain-containing protein (plasmid) [Rhizobium leguminosarum]|uniref:DUF1028 domain-containing protein n=1 Tax=Rhizobium laguerreae TaxID=1076926 RepID=A0A6N9ZAC5_9HYPH|nr:MULTISPECIES: DUF1028 domain-containing protein [Rhizobium]MBY5835016.1 DUF1028 domain-containing protein [Rhizobium leguminosarum]NEH90009.1 DUF1028 domain-containing protein [Rhizobium laguerreae]NKM75872.1 DUF1028 domain-containing protein [Rhizobium leguminosarum bv. viciae]QSZ11420.1 DUF1028 domain-containing protein [Rhizobium leguminosarum]TBY84976.1 DUF1028 domain-containing protein [Rhizobium leguminosarum bv. viciae]
MTFSIVARCEQTGQFGVAISSSSPAVASRCAWARAGIGAVATQNVTNPALGPRMLDELAKRASAADAVATARLSDDFPNYRQLLAVDAHGGTAIHSGTNALGTWTSAVGHQCVAAGNLLANDGVPKVMVEMFEATSGTLGDRLIAALRAAVDAGGEAGPVRSAGLLIVDKQTWPYAELRIDWLDDGCPIAAVARAWDVYRPQAEDYVTRALNPLAAPSYGVPGDE